MSLSSSPVDASPVARYLNELDSDLFDFRGDSFDSRSEPTDVPESGDELDFLTPSSRTAASHSGATTPTLQGTDQDTEQDMPPLASTRTFRTRPPRPDTVTPTELTTSLAKRKRTLLDFEGFEKKPKEESQNGAKKAKREDKKAVSAAFFLLCHVMTDVVLNVRCSTPL